MQKVLLFQRRRFSCSPPAGDRISTELTTYTPMKRRQAVTVKLSQTLHFGKRQSPRSVLFSARQRSVIFVNENENENGEKRENNEFVNEN